MPLSQLATIRKKSQQTVGFFGQHLVAQMPWGHNILIFSKSRDIKEAECYLQQSIENGWSRNVLALQIKTDLYKRQGKAVKKQLT